MALFLVGRLFELFDLFWRLTWLLRRKRKLLELVENISLELLFLLLVGRCIAWPWLLLLNLAKHTVAAAFLRIRARRGANTHASVAALLVLDTVHPSLIARHTYVFLHF